MSGIQRREELPSAPRSTAEQTPQLGLRSDGERELKSVVADLWEHSETLVRQELALVKAEYEARLAHAKAALQHGVISLGLFHAAYLTTLATLVLLLAQWLPPWTASLIIAIGASAAAFVFTRLSKRALAEATQPLASQSDQQRARQHAHS
jgi:Flp pilus assembly protein TadB